MVVSLTLLHVYALASWRMQPRTAATVDDEPNWPFCSDGGSGGGSGGRQR